MSGFFVLLALALQIHARAELSLKAQPESKAVAPSNSSIWALLQEAKARRLSHIQSHQPPSSRRLSALGASDAPTLDSSRSITHGTSVLNLISLFGKRSAKDSKAAKGNKIGSAFTGKTIQYLIILLATLTMIIETADRTIFSVGVVEMKKEMKLSTTGVASTMSAFLFPYIFTNLPGGALADKLGGIKVLMIALFFWSLSIIAMPISLAVKNPVGALDAMRAFCGLMQGVGPASGLAVVSQWLPAHARATGVGIVLSAFNGGNAVGYLLGGLVPALGWPTVFYIAGAVGLLVSVLGLPMLLQPSGMAALERKASGKKLDQAALSVREQFKQFLSWRVAAQLLIMAYVNSAINWTFFLVENWLPTYMVQTLGVDLSKSALLSALPWFVLGVFSTAAGKIADVMLKHGWKALRVRQFMAGISSLIPAVSWVLLAFTKNLYLVSVFLMTALAAHGTAIAGYHSHIQDVAPGNAGKIFGLTNTVAIIVALAEQYIIAAMLKKTGSFSSVFGLTAGISGLSFVLFMAFMKGEPLLRPPQRKSLHY